MRKEFFSAFHAMVSLSFETQDQYLVSKMKAKSEQILVAFLDLDQSHVAQSRWVTIDLVRALEEATELLDLLVHLRLLPLSPALTTKKQLMVLEHKLLNFKAMPEKNESSSARKEQEAVPITTAKKLRVKNKKVFDSEERILELIRQRGRCQTGEIIYVLKNNFSARTIQRHLLQLVSTGQLIKEAEDGHPKYFLPARTE